MPVLGADGAIVGEVTSGTFSPTLKHGIGLALITAGTGVGEGDEVAVDVRGRPCAVRVVKPPFVRLARPLASDRLSGELSRTHAGRHAALAQPGSRQCRRRCRPQGSGSGRGRDG